MKYVDLDGVLADLDGWLKSIDREEAITNTDMFMETAMYYYDRMFLELEPIENNIDKYLVGDYRILTSLPHPANFFRYGDMEQISVSEVAERYARLHANKLAWCEDKYIPLDRVIVVPVRKLKISYCKGKDDILYDDSNKTIKDWIAKGGIGKLVK